jgi:hypothetical protein
MSNEVVASVLKKLAQNLSPSVVEACIKEAQEESNPVPETAMAKLSKIQEREDFNKIAADPKYQDALVKLAQEAREERFILRVADVASDMAAVKIASLFGAGEQENQEAQTTAEKPAEGTQKEASVDPIAELLQRPAK